MTLLPKEITSTLGDDGSTLSHRLLRSSATSVVAAVRERELVAGWRPYFFDFHRAMWLAPWWAKVLESAAENSTEPPAYLIKVGLKFIGCVGDSIPLTLVDKRVQYSLRWASSQVKSGHRWSLATDDVWSLVTFSHRWSLVTSEIGSPVRFTHWWGLVTSGILVTGEVWSPV